MHIEYPKWLYAIEAGLEAAKVITKLVHDPEQHDAAGPDWHESPDAAKAAHAEKQAAAVIEQAEAEAAPKAAKKGK